MTAAQALARYSVLALCFAAPLAFSQTGGQTGGNTGGGSNTSAKPAPSRPTIPQPQPQQQERRPVFLSGRVLLDDGTAPSERIAIERVCDGRIRREAYTDSSGHFSFLLGADLGMFQDASVGSADAASPRMGLPSLANPSSGTNLSSTGFNSRDLMACELRANLAGFLSDTISLAGRQPLDYADVGTIVLHRIGKVEGTKISMTTLKAPKDAKKAFERGAKLLQKQKLAEAAEEFAKAITVYPNYAEALVRLGDIYADQGRGQDAAKLFQQAIEADPKFLVPYLHLAVLAAKGQHWEQTAAMCDRALALDAYEYPSAYFYNAVANYYLHNLDKAEKNARMARRLDSQYRIPRIDLLLANILWQRQDYPGTAEQLHSFLKHQPAGADAEQARTLLGEAEQKIAATTAATAK